MKKLKAELFSPDTWHWASLRAVSGKSRRCPLIHTVALARCLKRHTESRNRFNGFRWERLACGAFDWT
jgi:hypothetical protein